MIKGRFLLCGTPSKVQTAELVVSPVFRPPSTFAVGFYCYRRLWPSVFFLSDCRTWGPCITRTELRSSQQEKYSGVLQLPDNSILVQLVTMTFRPKITQHALKHNLSSNLQNHMLPCTPGTGTPLCRGFSDVARGQDGAQGAACRAALVESH